MDRLFRTMRNTGSARQAGEMAQTSTSVDGLETMETRNHALSRTPQARRRCAGRRENGGQLRWTVAPCQNSSAEPRSVQRLLRLARASRAHCSWLAQPAEPPDADPHVRSCGRGGRATVSPIPIWQRRIRAARVSSDYLPRTRRTKEPGFILPRRSPGAGGSKSAAGRKMLWVLRSRPMVRALRLVGTFSRTVNLSGESSWITVRVPSPFEAKAS